MPVIDLKNKVFGRVRIVERDSSILGRTYWICICECGNKKSIRGDHLKTGKISSCGCLMREVAAVNTIIHGATMGGCTQEYIAWRAMKQRCYSKSYHARDRYAGRGIIVCKRWISSFEIFLKDMGPKPSKAHSLDRYPNKNGNYEPGNCRWATVKEQQNNKESVVMIEYNGIKKTLSEWAGFFNRNISTISEHLKRKTISQIFSMYKK